MGQKRMGHEDFGAARLRKELCLANRGDRETALTFLKLMPGKFESLVSLEVVETYSTSARHLGKSIDIPLNNVDVYYER